MRKCSSRYLFISLSCIAGASCKQQSKNVSVHFRLPTGFVGVFVVREDPLSDLAAEVGRETSVFVVPQNGVVTTQSMECLRKWHTTHATYVDGQEIPWIGAGSRSLTQETVAFKTLVTEADGSTFFIVDTVARIREFESDSTRMLKAKPGNRNRFFP